MKTLHCPSCSAPATYVQGDTVVTCPYCGSAIILEQDSTRIIPVKEHFLIGNTVEAGDLPRALEKALGALWLRPRDLLKTMVPGSTRSRLLPYWIVRASARTRYTGSDRRATRAYADGGDEERSEGDELAWDFDGGGDELEDPPLTPAPPRTRRKKRRIHVGTRYHPRSGRFEASHQWPVYARRSDEYWGQDALRPGGLARHPDWGGYLFGFLGARRSRPIDLTVRRQAFGVADLPPGMQILNGQIDQKEAQLEARQEIEEWAWNEAAAKVSVLTQCVTAVKIHEAPLVHVPLWWVTYAYRGTTYHGLFHGATGELVALSYPVGAPAKVAVSALLALSASALLWLCDRTIWRGPDLNWLPFALAFIWMAVLLHLVYAIVTEGKARRGSNDPHEEDE